MLLVHLSFRFRKRIGMKNWRRLHYATYLAFIGATTHGLMSGTDSGRSWGLAIYVAAGSIVVGLTTWRISTARAPLKLPAATRPNPPVREEARPEPALVPAMALIGGPPPDDFAAARSYEVRRSMPADALQSDSAMDEVDRLRGKVAALERALGQKAYELQIASDLLRDRRDT